MPKNKNALKKGCVPMISKIARALERSIDSRLRKSLPSRVPLYLFTTLLSCVEKKIPKTILMIKTKALN